MVLHEKLFLVQLEFCVQRTTKHFFSQKTVIKLFTNQSESKNLPTGCYCRQRRKQRNLKRVHTVR